MAIRADSYSSTTEVKALTRHLLVGQSAFNSTTRPTGTDVEKFIDRASSAINVSVIKAGISASSLRANSTAKLLCDDWVTQRAVAYIEFTKRGTGYSGEENNRAAPFMNLAKQADAFVEENALGFKYLGVTVNHPKSEGLVFTGETAKADRPDPSDSSLEQPVFTRRQFDNHGAVDVNSTQ